MHRCVGGVPAQVREEDGSAEPARVAPRDDGGLAWYVNRFLKAFNGLFRSFKAFNGLFIGV